MDAADLFAKMGATKNRPRSWFHAGRRAMFMTNALARLMMCAGLMALPNAISTAVYAQQAVTVGVADIGDTVVGAAGPEAGVWVIAETTELPTKFARIVVTDDQGRYLIPDLPAANYSVWVRGYGLVDSAKLTAKPGQLLNHTAVPAQNEAAAAHYYPAIYWYAMMKIPLADEFGGKSNIPEKFTQNDWLKQMKNIGCIGCHQIGQESTRT
ncbi:carboxypeptidase-like regulatory domain-containing protein, partial [Bradyrhizobium sp.]|uniref:carboxypeptidase-like regulatory domain-containing protein n=1 Tax=Bradyrhizobium sp. TaxID=376 RepID=UPI003C724C31